LARNDVTAFVGWNGKASLRGGWLKRVVREVDWHQRDLWSFEEQSMS
jgi:hypothetical protein